MRRDFKRFAKQAEEELKVPFYLYEESSEIGYRKKLPDIREAEYEGLDQYG